jgi:hypothetical protein
MGRRFARFWGIAVAAMMPIVLIAGGAGAIVGGDDDDGDHPNVGLVIFMDQTGNVDTCTGTLVTLTVVLTAAHCLPNGLQFSVSFRSEVVRDGSTDNGLLYADPTRIYRNEEYDVGILTLAASATTVYPGIKPAALPSEGALDKYRRGDSFTHVGYGLDRYAKRAELISNPPTKFIRRILDAPLSRLSDTQLFTRSRDGHLCKGDSGGPVFDEVRGVMVALGNYVSGRCNGSNSGPRLDIEPVRDFLRDNGVPVPN